METGNVQASKMARVTSFKPGQTGNPNGRPKKPQEVPQPLRDVRWAYRNCGNTKKGSEQQEEFRKMLKEDRKEFLALMERLERQYRPTKKEQEAKKDVQQEAVVVKEPEDVGTEKALLAAERWLEEWSHDNREIPGS